MAEMVGRLDAQLMLRARLKACREGRRGVVLVSGDTGVGKSRLLAEERGYAERLGLHVLAGRAEDQRSARPFVALRTALEASMRAEQDPTLRRLASDVDQQLRVRTAPGPSTVARSLTRLVGAWARRAPVVLVVDDLQSTDRDTCDLLGQLLRQLAHQPVMVLASIRPPSPAHVDALLRTWERQLGPDVASVHLHPLDRHDALVLARSLFVGPAENASLEDVVSRAQGNPLVLEEAVWALQAQQPLEPQGNGDVAAALVLRRLHRLHTNAVAVAAVLALLERPRLSVLPLLAHCTGLDEPAVTSVLDALTDEGTVQLDGDLYRFGLPVVRRLLVEDLGPARRWQLHQQIAAQLLARRDRGEPVDLVELAPHLAASSRAGDETAIEVLLEVAAGYVHHAPQSAADWYGQVLSLLPEADTRRPRALADRARVLYLAGRLEEAVLDGQAAIARPADAAEADSVARTGTIVTAALLSLGRITDAVLLAERLLEAGADPLLRVRVQLAAGLNYLNRFEDCRVNLDAVLEAEADPTTTALAHGVRAQVELSSGTAPNLLRALDAAYSVPALPEGARLSALTNDATHSVLACELGRATAALSQARALADSLGAVAFDADLELTELMLSWRTGRWEGLEQRIERCVAELAGRGQNINLAMLAAMRLELLVAQGKLKPAASVDATLGAPDAVGFSFVAWAQAGYRMSRGDDEGALVLLRTAWRHDRDCGRVSSAPLVLSRLTETCLIRGRTKEANEYAETARELVTTRAMVRCESFVLRAAGLASRDVSLLRSAAESAERDGMPVEASLARLAAGRLSGDAEADLLPAIHGFAAVGAEAWRRQVAALLRAQGVTVPRPATNRTGGLLSDAELRLARLVQEGLSNKQIASALALSPKTIEVYLSRVFTKTGVRSRVELAVALSEGRLALQE